MIWKYIRVLLAICGMICVYLGISTSDYYVLELGQKEPGYVWVTIMLGLMMLLPAIVWAIYDETKEKDR